MNHSVADEQEQALTGLKRVPIQFLAMAPVCPPVKPQNTWQEPSVAREFPLPAPAGAQLGSAPN